MELLFANMSDSCRCIFRPLHKKKKKVQIIIKQLFGTGPVVIQRTAHRALFHTVLKRCHLT